MCSIVAQVAFTAVVGERNPPIVKPQRWCTRCGLLGAKAPALLEIVDSRYVVHMRFAPF